MKAKIICTKCKIQLGELSKPVISEKDALDLKRSFLCDEQHTMTVTDEDGNEKEVGTIDVVIEK